MFWGRIKHGDFVYRQTIAPLAFSGKKIAHPKFFNLQHDAASGNLIGSLAWDRFLPTIASIHAYGCRLSAKHNERRQAEGKKTDRKDRRVYCGSYAFKAQAVRSLAGIDGLPEVKRADVIHLIEDGEIAHVELKIALASGIVNLDAAKTAIIDRLWAAGRGPLRHICDCDKDVRDHPSELLEARQNTKCRKSGYVLFSLWRFARCHAITWLWKHGYIQPPTTS